MTTADEILQCPVTGLPLRRQGDSYVTDGGSTRYRILDDIAVLLPDVNAQTTPSSIIDFYDTFGWVEDAGGGCKETNSLTGGGPTQTEHTSRCITRLSKYFASGGDYILDVGSGSIPHPELLSYGKNFKKRVCIDLSITGLRQAKRKLGDSGIYVQGDATKLPFANGSVDAITCNHLIYQLPVGLQRAAILELWRVLKPGGIAVIVYRWLHSGISVKLENLAKKSRMRAQAYSRDGDPIPAPHRNCDEPQTRQWFETQRWPFEYSYDCFRLIDNEFMREYVPDNWRGQLFLNALFAVQCSLPTLFARYGQFPAIIIRKPAIN